ncbi:MULTISPECIES: nucleoside recognition domain-containing protein [unclassified Photobacterium]|uniref:nucleoside recognition domain-containing protein n=1 Tax=unclassified Photobacterium TaxID=2628852 RepID=UPI001EE0B1B5|nr:MULTISPECIES: nucleoside recognition domain-containing protein [unclassified Photobacterium]MCG3865277.1 YjiH family protein [Photobacterium sp. Ph6]MCG3876776.1 YjiH family protein [Photobacterium sp. Ph5]
MSNNATEGRKVTVGSYLALAFAFVFFSGAMQSNEWYGVLDFTTLNGSFGNVVYSVNDTAEGVETASTSLRGKGGSGARDGFIFALTLIPTVMFALGMINVLEHYGALDAARKLLTPLLRPLMGIPGNSGLALIASLQSTDAGAAMTRQLRDEGHLTKRETDVFTMFQFSAGAAIVNFFSSGAVLFTLTTASGELAVGSSIGLAVAIMFIFKFIGANIFRVYLNITEGKEDKNSKNTVIGQENA